MNASHDALFALKIALPGCRAFMRLYVAATDIPSKDVGSLAWSPGWATM